MSANEVIERILSEANAEAEKIKKQADEKAAQEKLRLQAELDSFNDETKRLAEKTRNEVKSQVLAQARMENAKTILQVKNALLEQTFSIAAEKIKSMDSAEYQQLMEKLILASVTTGDEEIVIDKNEKRIDQRFVERLNSKLSQNAKGNLKLSDSKADIGAGFILQKGNIRINGSLKVLLDTAKEQLLTNLAAELFSQE